MSDAPNAEVLAAVRKRAEAWGTKLIDLNPSKNSLLLFRPGRGTQIDLTDGDAKVLRRLLDGDRVRLSQVLPEDDLRHGYSSNSPAFGPRRLNWRKSRALIRCGSPSAVSYLARRRHTHEGG